MKNRPATGVSDGGSPSPPKDADARDSLRGTVARAGRLAARERARIEALGPLSKALHAVALALATASAALLLYGAIAFPDAPIRAAANGFEGKTGRPHTQIEYEGFKNWERFLLSSFGLLVVFGVAIAVDEKVRERARSKPPGAR